MTNPFTRFRRRKMERYFQRQYLWLRIDILAWLQICENLGMLISRYDLALQDTRAHFNDQTFQPRSKSK